MSKENTLDCYIVEDLGSVISGEEASAMSGQEEGVGDGEIRVVCFFCFDF